MEKVFTELHDAYTGSGAERLYDLLGGNKKQKKDY